MKIGYAGLLGVAQDILDIIENVNFKKIDAELHIYGAGNQQEGIEKFISMNQTNVIYHGTITKKQMKKVLSKYDVSLVPLST